MVNDILYLDSRKLILNPYDYQPSRDEIIGLQRLFYSRFGIDLTISLENPLVYEPFENEQHFLVYCKISDKDFNTQKQAMIEKLQRMENLRYAIPLVCLDSSNKIEYDGVLVILMEKEKLSGQNIFVLDDKYFDFTRSLFTPRNLAHLRDEKKLRKLVYLYSDFQLKFFTSTFLKKSTEQYGLNVVSDRLGTRLNREGVHVFVFNVMEGPLCRMRNKIKETALQKNDVVIFVGREINQNERILYCDFEIKRDGQKNVQEYAINKNDFDTIMSVIKAKAS